MKNFGLTSLCTLLTLGLSACVADDDGGADTDETETDSGTMGGTTGDTTTSTTSTTSTTDDTTTSTTDDTTTDDTTTSTTTDATMTSSTSDDATGTDGGSTGTGGGTTGGALPTFDGDVWPIISARCGGGSCHIGNDAGNLSMAQAEAYANLVGAESDDVAGRNRVEAGDPSMSYMWDKLTGNQLNVGGSGSPMPLGGSLSQAERDTIEAWIEGGAPEN